ncbi:MAG: SoxR reducing system RseC family protein [Patescibacteria group bacterium]
MDILLLIVLLLAFGAYSLNSWFRKRNGTSTQRRVTSSSRLLFPTIALIVIAVIGHYVFHWKVGSAIFLIILTAAVVGGIWWFRRKPAYSRFGGKPFGTFVGNNIKLIGWLVFHVAFWCVVANMDGNWDYVKEWWWGKYSLFLYPMHLIYITRGSFPDVVTGKYTFPNRITKWAFTFLFILMLYAPFCHVTQRESILSRYAGFNESGSAHYNIPGRQSPDSDELQRGQFNINVTPEGRDANGLVKKMRVGTLPAGTTWIQTWNISGRVYTKYLIYQWIGDRLKVYDKILVDNNQLASPDTDGDGFLTVSQSPLMLMLGADGKTGWKIVNSERYEFAPLAQDTEVFVLIYSDQERPGTGGVSFHLRSGI